MAGIYIHIPFCRQACHYCNFHFSTLLKYKEKLVEAIGKEIILRQHFLLNPKIETIYFGGGTPSLLSQKELQFLINQLAKVFDLSQVKEYTLEANPEDLTNDYLSFLNGTPINRLSIGVQSFFDEHLNWMNRTHNGADALNAIKRAQDKGLSNISLDLIYGIPGLTNKQWDQNMKTVFDLEINHLSSYSLTVEPRTALAKMISSQKLKEPNEEKARTHFEMLTKAMKENGFEHYEISNFAKAGKYALHNTNYWRGIPYIGFGPGAHSFSDRKRSWNVSNNQQYIKGININLPITEFEELKDKDLFNEYIMTHLRTKWGCHIQEIIERFGSKRLEHLQNEISKYIDQNLIEQKDQLYILTEKGKFFADGITASLFVTE